MQPVSSDHGIELACGTRIETHLNATGTVLYASNAVIENRLDAPFDFPIDQCCELTSWDAYVSPVCNPDNRVNREPCNALSVPPHISDFAYRIALSSNIRQESHALSDVEADTPKIDDVSPRLVYILNLKAITAAVLGMLNGNVSLKMTCGPVGLPAGFLIEPNGRVLAAKYGRHRTTRGRCTKLLALARKAVNAAA